jgi:L-asparaginase/beta-aspartyl-peptidase (threonine type)
MTTHSFQPALIAHGGAGAAADHWDGVEQAARTGLEALIAGADALSAAIAAAVVLEDDPRFNAGTGANLRLDGATIELDAAVMDSAGHYGAVAAISDVQNPVRVAQRVLSTPHTLLVGEGAVRFARRAGFPEYSPLTEKALERHRRVLELLRAGNLGPVSPGWDDFDLPSHWNFSRELEELLGPSDTIGAVARDRDGHFGVAASTGGTTLMLLGRVGDTPLIGAGLYAGPHGAVTATGLGEEITRRLLCKHVYDLIASGLHPEEACEQVVAQIPESIPVGVIALSRDGEGAASNRAVPYVILPTPV